MSGADELRILDLISVTPRPELSKDTFSGFCLSGAPNRIFGGQVAAQAMRAAIYVAPQEREIHSYYCLFLRPGDPAKEIKYTVVELRNGRSLSTYRIDATQLSEDGSESVILTATCSFHIHEEGPSFQDMAPQVIPAELCEFKSYTPPGSNSRVREPINFRWQDGVALSSEPAPPRQLTWIKTKDRLPDDQKIHACALVYMTDLTLTRTAHMPLKNPQSKQLGASLDHSMHFHRPFRADEWMLFEQEAASYAGSRSIASGKLFTEAGELAVSARQEALIRRSDS
jgi:acyl-CoA thioesterase-2